MSVDETEQVVKPNTDNLETLFWPLSRLGEAVETLAHHKGLSPQPKKLSPPPQILVGDDDLVGYWIETVAGELGLEARSTETPYADVERFVSRAGPAIFRLPGEGRPRFLILIRGGRRTVSLLGPDLAVHRLPSMVIRTALCHELESPFEVEIERLLVEAGVAGRRRERARAAILGERLSPNRVGSCWLLRLSSGASFWQQARDARLPRLLLIFTGAYTAQYLLWVLSWLVVGRAALQGRLDQGWLIAWALLLLTLIPFRLLGTWSQGLFAIRAGARLKEQLLYGALRLDPDEIRHQGVGQLLGRVIESEAVESLALSGGSLALVAGIELLVAALVLAAGAGGGHHVLLLLAWIGLTVLLGWRFLRERKLWTEGRLEMTHNLVERMVGHRTCLAQERSENWHDGEDQALSYYLALSKGMDRIVALLQALVPRGWLILGLFGLAPAFVAGSTTLETLAITLGGILLAYQALNRLAMGVTHLVGASIAWEQVTQLYRTATRPRASGGGLSLEQRPKNRPGTSVDGSNEPYPVLQAYDLVFRYSDRADPILRGCNLQVKPGDRLLLEGPSGGGKSTLASLLCGLRQPESGLLLLNGFDRQSLGAANWRRQVVGVPQFHENHVLTETFAFNLLMGRRWPPHPEDIQEAEAICRELGLGDLLGRMPAGLLQTVGETGWQLSHGERSRLYLARALLQGGELIVLDESFAALDPKNLHRALRCVLDRADTLLVIAHP